MKSLALLAIFTVSLLSLTGCDSVTVVERRHDRRSHGYHGHRDYDRHRYDDRRHHARRSNTTVIVNRPTHGRTVRSQPAPSRRGGYVPASSRSERHRRY